jgi:hypothetical protein
MNKMSEAQFEAQRATLRETYGGSKREAGVRYEQELAKLFARSGWTQEQLAEKEGKSQSYTARLLKFGQFLEFMPNGINAETPSKPLTEGEFRSHWGQTKGNERQRFAEVARQLQEGDDVKIRPSIAKDLIQEFGDGKWHPIEAIAEKFDVDAEYVASTLHNMNKLLSSDANNERKQVGKSFHYRIFKKTKMVSVDELTTKLGPLLDRLKHEGKKRVEAAAPAVVASIAFEIQKIIDEWSR